MMTNLFSSFDPSTNILSLNWFSSLVLLFFFPHLFLMVSSNRMMWSLNLILMNIYQESVVAIKSSKPLTILTCIMFSFILISNFLGLFPYIFTSTSHMSISLFLSLSVWFSSFIFGWLWKSNQMFSHLVPMGTPILLMPFMVMIETISSMIRPLTLAVRLSANMIAGHLLLALVGNQLSSSTYFLLVLSSEMALFCLELAVALIQSYVFVTLISLYISEVSEKN